MPQVNENASLEVLGEYYMPFLYKANYPGPFDEQGIPLLNYHGTIGLQYNPIAVAQYALGHYNLFKRTGDKKHFNVFLKQADWLVKNLEVNSNGLYVWNHHFDWEYRDTLKAPWYSALAQGQGISVLVRAHKETEKPAYLDAADKAFVSFQKGLDEGGVTFIDENGYVWFEEAIVHPPTHILNGFIWAAWGMHDYYLYTGDQEAGGLFAEAIRTLEDNLPRYDIGFWSLYEQSGTHMKMLASPFYHHLHIVQLQVMHKLTGKAVFAEYAQRWEAYRRDPIKRMLALAYKALFKLLYY